MRGPGTRVWLNFSGRRLSCRTGPQGGGQVALGLRRLRRWAGCADPAGLRIGLHSLHGDPLHGPYVDLEMRSSWVTGIHRQASKEVDRWMGCEEGQQEGSHTTRGASSAQPAGTRMHLPQPLEGAWAC